MTDQPTILSDGTREWRRNGALHRDGDLPAIETPEGTQEWYRNGHRHRDGDLPAVIRVDGTREWYQDDLLHRTDGPAVEDPADGYRAWYRHGRFLRSIMQEPRRQTAMADLARAANERETTRLDERDKKPEPLARLAELARAVQQRVLKERDWLSR